MGRADPALRKSALKLCSFMPNVHFPCITIIVNLISFGLQHKDLVALLRGTWLFRLHDNEKDSRVCPCDGKQRCIYIRCHGVTGRSFASGPPSCGLAVFS